MDDDGTLPPASGEVEGTLRVVVLSTRVGIVGSGVVVVARDVAELLMALDEHPRLAVVVDAAHTPIELAFFARLARDFPPSVSILVQGEPNIDRRAFHDQGIHRAHFSGPIHGPLHSD